jgi:hypothetical protein
VKTVRAIVDHERGRAAQCSSMSPNWIPINPNDHSDHLMTAKVALDAVKDLSCVRKVYRVDYASSRLPENLDAQQRDMEVGVCGTLAGVQATRPRTSWHHYDKSYVGRNYFRSECSRPVRRTMTEASRGRKRNSCCHHWGPRSGVTR